MISTKRQHWKWLRDQLNAIAERDRVEWQPSCDIVGPQAVDDRHVLLEAIDEVQREANEMGDQLDEMEDQLRDLGAL